MVSIALSRREEDGDAGPHLAAQSVNDGLFGCRTWAGWPRRSSFRIVPSLHQLLSLNGIDGVAFTDGD